MSLVATLPFPTFAGLGRLCGFPLEVRQEIYHYSILFCRRIPKEDDFSYLWPDPLLLNDNSYIHVLLLDGRPYHQAKITNLLCVNSTIHREVEEVFHTRFFHLFRAPFKSFDWDQDLYNLFHARAKTQISRLSLLLVVTKAPGLTELQRRTLLVWKEGYTILVQCFSNLRTVCFEIRVPSSPVTTRLHKPMMEKCLAVARPLKDIEGLRMNWVGKNVGAHIAQLCESVSGFGEDWPWNDYDQSLYHLRKELDEGLVTISRVLWLNADG